MIPAVIYARYSSSNQREESIAGQLRECHAYAKRNNLKVIHEYTDSALTGTSDKRPAFQQMIQDSENRAFTVVIVWKLDRFARNRYDSAVYRAKLRKNGVRIVSAMENISDSPESIILEGLLESLAEYYSANLSENVKRGLYDSALERKILSLPSYGYKRGTDGKYEIDPDTAPIVQRIFNEYAAGKPYMQIIADLNSDGFRTAQNKPFSKNSLRRILRNEKYIGVYRYRDIIDPAGIPPIIEKELFEKVQKEYQRRSFTRPRMKKEQQEPFLLSGKLFCGHCGESMTGESARGKSGNYFKYYTCNGVKHKTGCKKKRIQKQWIESEIIRIINHEILTDEFIAEIAQIVIEYQEQQNKNSPVTLLEQQLKAEQAKLNNIIKAIENGIDSEALKNRMQELEQSCSAIKTRIQAEKAVAVQFTAEDVSAWLYALKRAEKTDSQSQAFLINACIGRIYIFDTDNDDEQRIVIEVNYSDRMPEPVKLDAVVRLLDYYPCFCVRKRTRCPDGQILLSMIIRKQ